jgi:hypothetical protein
MNLARAVSDFNSGTKKYAEMLNYLKTRGEFFKEPTPQSVGGLKGES